MGVPSPSEVFDALWQGCLLPGLLIGLVLMLPVALFGKIAYEQRQFCAETCHPVVGKRIYGVCHCATETGWQRPPGEKP